MPEKIVVTTCSVNYLAQAKALADSMIKHNPEYKVIIGLVDKLDSDFEKSAYDPHKLLQVHEMNLPVFEEMYKRYTLLELNCALKSFFVKWALDQFRPAHVLYLDADMLVYDSFLPIENMLKDFSILITPHITRPFPVDAYRPRENDILKTGMFNAGFFAVKNDVTGNSLIDWWKARMVDQGYERPKDGYNADQNWLNFVPLYFDNVKVVNYPGLDVAYWNFHERAVTKRGDKFFVNNVPLLLFHYSGYSVQHPDKIARHQDRFSMPDNPAIQELFRTYHQIIMENGHEELQKIPCYYKKESAGKWLKKLGLKK